MNYLKCNADKGTHRKHTFKNTYNSQDFGKRE